MTSDSTYCLLAYMSVADFNADKLTLHRYSTLQELHQTLLNLHQINTVTNQPLSEFAFVFAKGASYPTSYEKFWSVRNLRRGITTQLLGFYYIERKNAKGMCIQEQYEWAEDFDWELETWTEEGYTNICILNTNESINGAYYIERDIEHKWGKKEHPLFCG